LSQESPLNVLGLTGGTVIPDDQPYAKIKLVSLAGGMDKCVIKHRMLTKKLFDVKTLRDDDENRAKMFATDPTSAGTTGVSDFEPTTNQWIWYIAFIPVMPILPSESQIVTSIANIQVKVTYFCELESRNNIPYLTTTVP